MNSKNRVAAFFLGVVMTASYCLVGCMKNNNNNNTPIEVFGVSAMYKFDQRHVFADAEKNAEIKVSAAANEYESAQIIICANSETVASYDVTASDFVSENGAKIEKSNIELYSAYYNSISSSQNGYPSGYVPDVLIPLQDRKNYGDNQVAPGENQSVWFTVYIPKGTPAGEYKSEFSVKANEKNFTVPVKLNVYGFELPDETHVKSAFGLWGPSDGNDMLTNIYGTNARAAENTYYEFLLKYRVAPRSFPNRDLSSAEAWVDQAVEYAQRADVPSFVLPFRNISNPNYNSWFDEEYMHDVLSLLVDRSTEEFNIFDKVYAKGVVDEPDYTGELQKTRDYTAAMQAIIGRVLAEKDAEGAFEGKPSVREKLKNIAVIITISCWGEELDNLDIAENVTGWCPKFALFDDEETRIEFAELQKNGISIWAYGCNVPGWPYPTYQVDADMVSPRSLGVMQMRYNIDGNLFWCTNVSRIFNGSAFTDNWDPYKTHYAFASWAGDGYLVVPAGRYNERSIKPYPTMRLEMIREGQEDYEYLYLLKSLVSAKGNEAIEKLEQTLELEYAKILDGAKPTEDPKIMIAFKEAIAALILQNL